MIAIELGLRIGEASFGADHPLRSVSTVDQVTDLIELHEPGELAAVAFSVGPRNSYDYRLVVSRKLYDRAVGTEMSRSLVNLAPGSAAHVNPLDLDALGVSEGDDVKLVSSKASTVLPITADDRVPRGVLWAPFNQPGGSIEEIIDASAPVTDVRIERV